MERLRESRWSSNATEARRPFAPFSPIRFELAAASRTRYEKARHARCRAIESVERALHNGADMPAAMRCGAAQRVTRVCSSRLGTWGQNLHGQGRLELPIRKHDKHVLLVRVPGTLDIRRRTPARAMGCGAMKPANNAEDRPSGRPQMGRVMGRPLPHREETLLHAKRPTQKRPWLRVRHAVRVPQGSIGAAEFDGSAGNKVCAL